MKTKPDRIVVYGATGLTGGLVVEALRARGERPVIAGRRLDALLALAAKWEIPEADVRQAAADDPDALAVMLADARVVIACAGPFLEAGWTLVRTCAEKGVHYVDSTGEAPFVRRVYQELDAVARAKRAVLAPATAFEVTVGDAAAHLASEGLGEGVDVAIGYRLGGFATATSQGTRASSAGVIADGGGAHVDGAYAAEALAAHTRTLDFGKGAGPGGGISFPSPEILTVPRHVPARTVRAFLRVPVPGLASMGAGLVARLGGLGPHAVAFLRRVMAGDRSQAPDAAARAASRFDIVAEARSADGTRTQSVIVHGRDPYGLTAQILSEAAVRLRDGKGPAAGVRAPSEVVPADVVMTLCTRDPGTSIERT